MRSILLAAGIILLLSAPSWAGSLGISFNDESAQVDYLQSLSREAYGESEAVLRLLYNDETEVFLGNIGAGVKGAPGNLPGIMTGVRVHVIGANTDIEDLFAVGIGLQVEYLPPRLQGLGLRTGILYAPDVFTFMDAEDYLETGVGLFFTFMPRAALTLSYQKVMADFEQAGKVRLDETVRIGIQLEF